MERRLTRRTILVIAVTALCLATALLLPGVPQPLEYHDFADHRAAYGIANFLDVTSNLGFLAAGLAGLVVCVLPTTCFERAAERWPYALCFVGMLLTALGSAYYHLAPDNERLFWDRLPMTIAFMSLVAAQIVDRINVRAGLALLIPLVLIGIASVVYWRASERAGAGNVLPYALLQAYAVAILLVIALSHESRYTRGSDVYWVFGGYILAKLFETFDRPLFALGQAVSGHTLKHLAAAVAGLVVCHMLRRRTLRAAAAHGAPRARTAVAALGVLLALGGCQFGALRENLRVLNQNGYLRGTVTPPPGASGAPLVVFAVRADGSGGAADDWVVLARPGPYFLVVPVGDYRVGGFEDRNHSLVHDPDEPIAWVRGGDPVKVRPGETSGGLNLALRPDAAAPPVDVALLPVRADRVDELPASRVGEVVSIDDPRFSEPSARLGLWQPAQFLVDVGAGIYMLEPYDPQRTPVLFVHGALGHPGNFSGLIASLDRSKYQAWVAFYPSAVALEVAGAALGRWLQALEIEYGFHRLAVVAHSMGGLVSRSYLVGDPNGLGGTIDALTFVSIATPWQGHAGAALGIAHAPVAAPAWFDLAPGSPFLGRLLDLPLPRYAAYDLFFAYGGARRSRTANDGTVTVASQLDLRAQRQAQRVMGFDAGHLTVLFDPEVAAELQRSLAAVAPPAE
ncbi:MAG: hypothetical protein SF182_00290 [Deltaproteobacteria bacterium]|nr:hypothetical protein [Deltaproteobacteria bacterium]